jgi:hypothetical protein
VHHYPPNTSHETHQPSRHLLHTHYLKTACRVVLIATGVPEGPNELAQSEGYTLDSLFARADEGTAVAQVYVGPRPLDILRVSQRMPSWLRHALLQAKGAEQIHISAMSAGVVALWAFRDLPADLFRRTAGRVSSLTLASPFLGTGCARHAVVRLLARLLGFPSTSAVLDSIAPLVESLLERQRPVQVNLGDRDQLIDHEVAAAAFSARFPAASLIVRPRRHGPPPEELWPDW